MKLICSVLLLFSLFGKAQVTFQKSYYMGSLLSDGANDLCVIEESSFYIACDDYKVLKLDSAGNVIWAKAYYQTDSLHKNAVAFKIEKTSDNNLIVLGEAVAKSVTDTSKLLLSKIDTAGNLIWTKVYFISKGQYLPGGVTERNGFFYISIDNEFTDSISLVPTAEQLLFCTDTAGNFQWAKRLYNNTALLYLSSVTLSMDTMLFIAGCTIDSADNNMADIVISKLDINGNLIITKRIDLFSTSKEVCRNLILTPDSCLLLVCTINSTGIVLIKMDLMLNVVWSTFTQAASPVVYEIINLNNGGFLINNSKAIFAYNDNGQLLWTKNYGISGWNGIFKAIHQYKDGGFIAVGRMSATTRTFIIRTDSTGNANCYTFNTIPFSTSVQTYSDTLININFDTLYLFSINHSHIENVVTTDTTWCLNYVGIDEIANYDALVFPNPIMSGEKLLVKGYYGQLNSISVFDAYGRICYSFLNINQNYFDFETKNLKSGIYFIVINNIKTFKLIVI